MGNGVLYSLADWGQGYLVLYRMMMGDSQAVA